MASCPCGQHHEWAHGIFGILTPNKGLSLGDNPVGEANWAAPIAFMPAFIVAFVLMVIVVVMLRNLPAADDTK